MLNKKRNELVVWLVLLPFVLWAAALLAQSVQPGMKLDALLNAITQAFSHPFSVSWTDRTAAYLIAAVLLYSFAVGYYYASRGRTRPGEEHGSAEWGNAAQVNRKYSDPKSPGRNITLTQNVSISLDTHKHRRNLNILVVGGSGAGKSRSFAKPGLMNSVYSIDADPTMSYLVTDPKGELLRDVGPLLEKTHRIRVLNLVEMSRSDCFNPMAYLRDDKDVLKQVSNLIKNTTPKNSQSNDPFWEKAETALVSAFVLYLMHEAPAYEQNYPMVMYMIENAAASENDESQQSPIDILFETLEEENPNHIAVRQYKVFKQAAGKTAKSILVSAAVRLNFFNISEFAAITSGRDGMELDKIGEEPTALFCIIPDNDSTFNFLVSMLYTAAYQEMYYKADHVHGGSLPLHVRCIKDEWANIAQPEDYPKIISTCRSRNISENIIVQNISQIKSLYKDHEWESIIGNLDTLLYLGGNEQSTHEYISKMLGKATIDTKTHGLSKGKNGNTSENFQNAGRELLQPDEVRMLDNDFALLFIRGERPVMDRKFDLTKHKALPYTVDGGAEPYKHPLHFENQDISFDVSDIDSITIEE